MRASNLLPAAACLLAAAPASIGTEFRRLDRGRAAPASLPSDTRLVAVYYGAGWCGPCRALVPELIAAYPRLRSRGIELLFVSDDQSCGAELDYARTSRMPWLLLPCDRDRRRRLRALGGEALPGIVVVDRSGHVVSTSWSSDGESRPRATIATLFPSGPRSD